MIGFVWFYMDGFQTKNLQQKLVLQDLVWLWEAIDYMGMNSYGINVKEALKDQIEIKPTFFKLSFFLVTTHVRAFI